MLGGRLDEPLIELPVTRFREVTGANLRLCEMNDLRRVQIGATVVD